MYYDVVVIGGGVAGGEASTRLARSLNKKVALVSSTPVVYSRMTLSYGLKRSIKSITPFTLYEPDDLRRKGVSYIYDKAVSVDVNNNTVYLESGLRLEYGDLVLASGSKPNIPDIEGIDLGNIYTFQTFDDMITLDKIAEPGKKALVVGSGMIGLLASDALSYRGVKVYAIDLLPYPGLTVFEEPLAKEMLNRMSSRGVIFMGGVSVERLEGDSSVRRVILTDGTKLDVDFVVFSIGVSANLPRGLEKISRGQGGSVLTDEYFRASVKNIYAIGDCATILDYQTKKHMYRPLGILASYAAKRLPEAFRGAKYDGFLIYQVEEAFNSVFIRLGINSFEAKRLGINYSYAYIRYKAPGVGFKKDLVIFEKGIDIIIGWQSVGAHLVSYKSRIFEELIRSGARLEELEEKKIKVLEIS
ncbi:MAG: NAD(P)/FAD-dependent oxidoreductase [Sulfolobales archaeon]